MQDASFITADPGPASADTPRGDPAETRHSRDGTWAKKGSNMDKLIRRFETTTASVHSSRIDPGRSIATKATSG